MRLLIQRVKSAQVEVAGEICGSIAEGALAFLGIHKNDQLHTVSWLAQKLCHLRLFQDEEGKMNRSLKDVQGELLIVSQFTLYGNCAKGRRPDFLDSAAPSQALPLYEAFIAEAKKELPLVQTGKFGAQMEVGLVNDGPVTFLLEKF